MALPADFSKIFGSTATGGLTPISDVNYAKGWEYLGANPPEKNDFSYVQNLSDLKAQWLYANKLQRSQPFADIKADGSAAITTALSNLGITRGGFWYKLGDLIIQFGIIDFSSATTKSVNFPIRFPSQVDQVIVSDAGWGGGNMWGATEQSIIGFTAHVNTAGEGGQWIAFGR